MAKEFQLTYRSDDGDQTEVNDLHRILNLAGISVSPDPETAATACDGCGSQEHSSEECHSVEPVQQMSTDETGMEGLDEEQADNDYGHQDVSSVGHEVDPSIASLPGTKLPQRIVKGTQGDNPLISEIHAKLLEEYTEFLTEDDTRENDDGALSPLSDPTKPEFDKDPLSGEPAVTDGSHSPMSTIARQAALK